MFDQSQIKQLIQADEQAWYACPHQTCLISGCPSEQNMAHQTRERNVLSCLIECFMALKFIKHHQTRSNSTKQGGQTTKCLVTKQCLICCLVAKRFPFGQGFRNKITFAIYTHAEPWEMISWKMP